MLRGMYTVAAGMITQQRKHDTITNNIANLSTPGFKQGTAVSRSFPEMLIALVGGDSATGNKSIGKLNTGVIAEEDLSIYLQGDLQETGNTYDVAIVSNILEDLNGNALPSFDQAGKYVSAEGEKTFQPQAFITVVNGAGEPRYSRNGRLTLNSAGELVTPEGYRVLGSNGEPISLVDANGEAIANVKILADGTFVDDIEGLPVTDAAGEQLALLISRVENPNRMVREGNGVYRVNAEDEGGVTQVNWNEASGQIEIRQGYLERSNVDSAQSAVDLMAALRAYEANQKMVQFYDKSLEKAVNEVGRV